MEKMQEVKKERSITFRNTRPPYYYNGTISVEVKSVAKIEKEIIVAGLRGVPFN
jgi:hypothetical protein